MFEQPSALSCRIETHNILNNYLEPSCQIRLLLLWACVGRLVLLLLLLLLLLCQRRAAWS
jgi:hypothetical protein